MTPLFKHRDSFHVVPSFDELVEPYKIIARDEKTPEKKLTDCQHKIAGYYSFKDWQSLTYWIKTIRQTLETIDLTCNEWGYVFDLCNGWLVTKTDGAESLMLSVIDSDRYDALSGKWFDDFSKSDHMTDEYQPSKTMKSFIEKLQKYSDEQMKAIIFKGMAYWDRPLGM